MIPQIQHKTNPTISKPSASNTNFRNWNRNVSNKLSKLKVSGSLISNMYFISFSIWVLNFIIWFQSSKDKNYVALTWRIKRIIGMVADSEYCTGFLIRPRFEFQFRPFNRRNWLGFKNNYQNRGLFKSPVPKIVSNFQSAHDLRSKFGISITTSQKTIPT